MKFSAAALGLVSLSQFAAARKHPAGLVDKKSGKNDIDMVDLRFNINLNPEQITDEHLDYLEYAIQYAFDETNPAHMYKSTGVELQVLKPDDAATTANNQDLQGGDGQLDSAYSRWWASAFNQRGCQFCPTDDAFVTDTATLRDRKTLKNWAKAVCDALNDSNLKGFDKASGCMIDLPYGGVGDSEENSEQVVALTPTRVVHSGKKKSDPMAGEDEVGIHFNMDIEVAQVTDAHLDYLVLALQHSFDETNRGHMYRSTGAQVNYLEFEGYDLNSNKKKEDGLRGGNTVGGAYSRWFASAFNQRGCQFCPTDDAFLSDAVDTLRNEKTLKNWAKSLCGTLNDSPLDGFKNAQGCQIELPNGGVEATKQENVATSIY